MERLGWCLVLLLLAFSILSANSLEAASGSFADLGVLRLNMKGSDVVFLQECLLEVDYLDGPADGVFGPATHQAVLRLQKASNLKSDGIVGSATWQALEGLLAAQESIHVVKPGETLWGIARQLNVTVRDLVIANGISNPDRLSVGAELVVPRGRLAGNISTTKRVVPVRLVHWDEVDHLFPKAATATVLDLQSGLRFQVRRLFGTYHADVEPLTAADTRTMKRALGGQWSWARRPIVVEFGGLRIAASMNGVPHGSSSIKDNGFPGHFCVHFRGSRLHSGERTDREHQAAVMQAMGYNQDTEKVVPSR